MPEIIKIDPHNPDISKIKQVAAMVRAGKIVAVPTETVYGLTCNLDDNDSVQRLYKIKERPANKKVSIHIARKGDIDIYATELPYGVRRLVDKYWPGPLTLVCKAKYGENTVGLRCPDHKVASLILEAAFAKVGMSSANLSGTKTCASAQDIVDVFGEKIDCIVDCGPIKENLSSTVVDVTQSPFKILRQGDISANEILQQQNILKLLFVCTGNTCRSPMAEYYYKKFFMNLSDSELPEVEVKSCGTMAASGGASSNGTREVLAELDIDVSGHRSQIISEELVNDADIIITMGYMHYQTVKNFLRNDHYVEVLMLRDLLDGQIGMDVPDPIGGTIDTYKKVFDVIKNIEEPLKKLIIKVAKRKQELL